jgi:hypothetical protein
MSPLPPTATSYPHAPGSEAEEVLVTRAMAAKVSGWPPAWPSYRVRGEVGHTSGGPLLAKALEAD